jgi:hypothetical protein
VGLLGATLLLLAVLTAAVFGIAALRRRARGDAVARDVAESHHTFLASNWDAVERAAARGGMDAEQLADVRRKVLGG